MKGDITYLKGKGFDANPQNINRAGRPRKQLSYIIEEIKDLGYTSPSQCEIIDMCGLILSLTESDMKIIAEGENYPMLMRIVATRMLGIRGFETVEKILDRIHGKAIPQNTGNNDRNFSIAIKDTPELNEKQMKVIAEQYLASINVQI